MALMKCPECGNMVSDKAAKCPKCGASINLIKNANSTQHAIESAKVPITNKVDASTSKSNKGILLTIIISVIIIVSLILCYFIFLRPHHSSVEAALDSAKPEQIMSTSQQTSVDPKEILNKWCQSHAPGKVDGLRMLYADNVKYYQTYCSKDYIISTKRGLLEKYSDFTQSYTDYEESRVTDKVVVINFMKLATFNGQHNNYKSYLVLKMDGGGWEIVEEGDATTDKNLFKKSKSFVHGLKKFVVGKDDGNTHSFIYESNGYSYTVEMFFNQVAMSFIAKDKQGNKDELGDLSLETNETSEYPASSYEYVIGTYDFDYDGIDELIIAERLIKDNMGVPNIIVKVFGLRDSHWKFLCELKINQLDDFPTADIVTNSVRIDRQLRGFYAKQIFQNGTFVDSSDY